MDYPPKGEEKKALKIIQRICRRIDELESGLESMWYHLPKESRLADDFDLDWIITPTHALQGIRRNEEQQTTTLAAFLANTCRLLLYSEHIDAAAEQMKTALRDLVKVCGAFKLCPSCKGKRGEWQGGAKRAGWDSYWYDCKECVGRGVLEVEKVQLLKEYDTYLPAEQQLDTRIDCIAMPGGAWQPVFQGD